MEKAIVFESAGNRLVGILHAPKQPSSVGVMVVVGGPQYRVGSHRQFVIMARRLADLGISVFRFDYAGMGDSEGSVTSFENVEADIQSALDTFFKISEGLENVVLWGLCDGASAASMFAAKDKRIKGLVLVNPWVTDSKLRAQAYLSHYYSKRIFEKSLWRKILRGELSFRRVIKGVSEYIRQSRTAVSDVPSQGSKEHFREKMLRNLLDFQGQILYIISGRDLTAAEFCKLEVSDTRWQQIYQSGKATKIEYPDADHTFSRRQLLDEMIEQTGAWVLQL